MGWGCSGWQITAFAFALARERMLFAVKSEKIILVSAAHCFRAGQVQRGRPDGLIDYLYRSSKKCQNSLQKAVFL